MKIGKGGSVIFAQGAEARGAIDYSIGLKANGRFIVNQNGNWDSAGNVVITGEIKTSYKDNSKETAAFPQSKKITAVS